MTHAVIKLLPNLLTTVRLFLAVPIALLIVNEQYALVLWLVFIAGGSDALDGYLARKWHATSNYGAIVDPLADKALLLSTYIAFALVGLLPYWLAVIVLLRDALIVSGVLIYRYKFGHYKMAPSIWGKSCTAVQILFALMVLMQQLYPLLPEFIVQLALFLVTLLTFISGAHYVHTWGGKVFS